MNKIENWLHDKVYKAADRLMWLGVVLFILGAGALIFPFLSTLMLTFFVGWLLILSGLTALFGAFSIRGAGPFFGALLYGLLSLSAGLFIVARPVAGALAVTLAVAALFTIQAAYEIYFAVELKPLRGWGWMLGSGLISILLALVILAGLPVSSLVTLGIVFGMNFASSGLALMVVGAAARKEIDRKFAHA